MASITRRENVTFTGPDGRTATETFRGETSKANADTFRAAHPGAKGAVFYDVRWRLPDGRGKSKAFRRRADADAFRRQLEHDEMRGVIPNRQHAALTVSELAAAWLQSRPNKRPRSLQLDTDGLRLHVEPTLGAVPVRAVTRADIQRLVDTWAAAGLAPSTIARHYSTVRAMFSYAEHSDIIVKSPCRGVRLPPVRPPERPHLDPGQLEALAAELGPEWAPMMWLGAVLGLRWSEVAGLRAADIDFDAGKVAVTAQLARDGSLVAPKSAAGWRRMSAPGWLLDGLREHLAAFPPGADGLVFVKTKAKTPLSYAPWRRLVWLPATIRAGLEGVRFHDLRSWAATAMVAEGVDVKTAQARLGHSSPYLTLQVYARATQDADRAAAEAVGRLFRPPVRAV